MVAAVHLLRPGRGAARLIGTVGLLVALAEPSRAAWRNFTTGDGMASNSIRDVFEDHAENMWFAANGGGVNRWDGLTWQTLTTADGLPSNGTTQVFEDRSGVFWFGTGDKGVARWDGRTWQTFDAAHELGGNQVTSITEDRAGNVWVTTWGGGAARRDPAGGWMRLTVAQGMPNNNVQCAFEDYAGRMWFGTSEGPARWDGPGHSVEPVPGPLVGSNVSAVVEDLRRNMWFSTRGSGVGRRDSLGVWKVFTTTDGLPANDVISILVDRSGVMWFGTGLAGVSRFDGAAWRTFRQLDGLYIWGITQDRSGNLWFACTGGAMRYDGTGVRTFPELTELANDVALTIYEDVDGSVWFGSVSSGAWHFDGTNWESWTTDDGLLTNAVPSVFRDRAGNLWFPCYGGGAMRRSPQGIWKTFTVLDGLPSNYVQWFSQDRDGKMWVATQGGVARFDDPRWTPYTTPLLGSNDAVGVIEDVDGNLWFPTRGGGVTRRTPAGEWKIFRTAEGLAGNFVWGVLRDRDENMWFACRGGGASRLARAGLSLPDPAGHWKNFTVDDGLANNFVMSMSQDRAGNFWFAQDVTGGVARFDGTNWRHLGLVDGLPNSSVAYTHEDRGGNLWITTFRGLCVFEPDRVPPRTIFSARPPHQSSSRHQTAGFAALGESDRLEYSHRLDSGAWSDWSSRADWSAEDLPDGTHVLEVRARDYWVNVDPTPEVTTFEIDGTPPSAVIAAPAYGAPVRGVVDIQGTATDARFESYEVAMRPAGATEWTSVSPVSLTPIASGRLAAWDTGTFPDGSYELRVVVADTLGLTGAAQVVVVVDNHAPFFDQTSPVPVTAASGGDVFTTGAEMHLYVPPYAFQTDAIVTIAPLTGADAPPSLPGAGAPVSTGYALGFGDVPLAKAATLDVSLAGVNPGSNRVPALYRSTNGSTWSRLGGTVKDGRLALAIAEPGRYALYADDGAPGGTAAVVALSFTPRVFSPRGNFATRDVGIGFSLGRAATVTVKVYDPSGRLVREVATGQPMGAGANLVRWDGHDRLGDQVSAGLYVVTVEALGETQKKTLAVVR